MINAVIIFVFFNWFSFRKHHCFTKIPGAGRGYGSALVLLHK